MSDKNKRPDHYGTLGVAKDASSDDIRKAYRRLALKHHPDRNPGDAAAEARFKELATAYQVLSDDEKRAEYDLSDPLDGFGRGGFRGAPDARSPNVRHGVWRGASAVDRANLQDMLDAMLRASGSPYSHSRSVRGGDVRVRERLTLKDVMGGGRCEVTASVACAACDATGMRSTRRACDFCSGSGRRADASRQFTSACPACQGSGSTMGACGACAGVGTVPRKVMVKCPAGIDTGQWLRVPGLGLPGRNGGSPGDLFVDITVTSHERFDRDGDDLHTCVEISITKAALGGAIELELLDGSVLTARVRPGAQGREELSIEGQGVPRIDGRGRGSLYILLRVVVPRNLSPRAEELLRELDREL